jgi:hypothetical protein
MRRVQVSISSSSAAGVANEILFFFCNSIRSYTLRRLEASTYQFEELALKAIMLHQYNLAVELLINSLAVDDQQEETW